MRRPYFTPTGVGPGPVHTIRVHASNPAWSKSALTAVFRRHPPCYPSPDVIRDPSGRWWRLVRSLSINDLIRRDGGVNGRSPGHDVFEVPPGDSHITGRDDNCMKTTWRQAEPARERGQRQDEARARTATRRLTEASGSLGRVKCVRTRSPARRGPTVRTRTELLPSPSSCFRAVSVRRGSQISL
jgi:hypothetical protein